MKKKLIAIASIFVLGFAGLLPVLQLRVSARNPLPLENDTYDAFIVALEQHEQRLARLQEQFQATLPHVGPLTQYQVGLLDKMDQPRPRRVLMSIHQCMQGGSGGRVSLISLLDAASTVVHRDREVKHFYAKPGWRFSKPTATNAPGIIDFDGSTGNGGRNATADLEDTYAQGQWAPHGYAGSGLYKVKCSGPGGEYSQSWRWSMFRDLPPH